MKTKIFTFLGTVGLWLTALLIPLMSVAQTYPIPQNPDPTEMRRFLYHPYRGDEYHTSAQRVTVTSTKGTVVNINGQLIEVPWYSPTFPEANESSLCESANYYYMNSCLVYEVFRYHHLLEVPYMLNYPLSEIDRLSFDYSVLQHRSSDYDYACYNPPFGGDNPYTPTTLWIEKHWMETAFGVTGQVNWSLYLSGSTSAFASGTGTDIYLSPSQRNALQFHDRMRVYYRIDYPDSYEEASVILTSTVPPIQATKLDYHTEYTIEGGEHRTVPGSKNYIGATANTPGVSVDLVNCRTRALEFEFNGAVEASGTQLRINGQQVAANITKTGDNTLFAELPAGVYFDFPMAVTVHMNGNDYNYTITTANSDAEYRELGNITFTERDYARYNSCTAIQGTFALGGWDSVEVLSGATAENGYYTVNPGITSLNVRKAYGYCRAPQTVPVPAVVTPAALQVSLPNGTSYCPSGHITAVIDNWDALQGATVTAEQDGWRRAFTTPSLTIQPGAGQVQFYAENDRGCLSDTTTVTIGLLAPTTILTQPQSQTLCTGEPFTLSVEAEGDNLTYQWHHNGNPVGTAATYSTTASTATAGNYHVVVSGACGTVTSSSVSVDIAGLPEQLLISGNTWTCNGQQALVTQEHLEPGFNYSLLRNGELYPVNGFNYWFVEREQAAGAIPDRVFNLPEGDYTLVASNRDKQECSADTNFTIAVRSTNFGLSFSEVNKFCRQEDMTDLFAALAGGYEALGGNTAQWMLGRSCDQQVQVIDGRYIATLALEPGFYNATLLVGDGSCDTTMCTIIEILARPENISISAGSTVCNGLPVTYTANHSELSYQWYLDGVEAESDNGHQFTQSYIDNGLHYVYAIGTDANGCRNISDTTTTEALTVTSDLKFKPAVTYETCPEKLWLSIADSLLNRSSAPSEYDNLAHGTITDRRFKYIFEGEGLAIQNKDYLDLYNSVSGTHTLYLKVRESFSHYDDFCSVRNDSMQVVIFDAPPIYTISPVSETPADTILLCNQSEITLQIDNPAANTYYLWFDGNYPLGYGEVLTHSSSSSSLSNYRVSASGFADCHRESENTILVERRFVDFDIRFDEENIAYCNNVPGGMVNLFDTISGNKKDSILNKTHGYSYTIASGELSILNGSVNLGLATAGQAYPVSLIAMKNGCSHTTSTTVTVNLPSGPAIITPTEVDPLCGGEQVTLTAEAQEALSFRWYRNGELLSQTANVLTETVNASATYTVEGYSPGCGAGQISNPVEVEVAPAPEVTNDSYSSRGRQSLTISMDVTENTTAAIIILYEDLTKTTVKESMTVDVTEDFGFYYIDDARFTVDNGQNYAFTVELISDNGCRMMYDYYTDGTNIVPGTAPETAPMMMPFNARPLFTAPMDAEVEAEVETETEEEITTPSFKATLIPTAANNGEPVRLLVQAATAGRAHVRVMDISGNLLHRQRVPLQEGHNEVDLTAARPSHGWFLVHVIYSDGTSEILKGLVQ